MKYCLLILLLLPLCCPAQRATVSATKMNVLYIGVDNPVAFTVADADCSKVRLAVADGVAVPAGSCACNVRVTKPGTVMVFLIRGRDTLYRTPYRVKQIPNPTTGPAPASGRMPLDSLRAQSGLNATARSFDYDARYTVAGFALTVVRERRPGSKGTSYCDACFKKISQERFEVVFSGTNDGPDFNAAIRGFIRDELRAGDKVFFDEIRAIGPDNQVRRLGSLVFTVE